MNRNISKEYSPTINFDRIIAEKRRYIPRNTSIAPVTRGKNKGPKYTKDECAVILHLMLYPGGIKGNKEKDIKIISEIFNRSIGSIKMTISNARTFLWGGKLVNASNNLKEVCLKYKKGISRSQFDKDVYNILKDYNYNIR